jgi:16S rRNA (cytosine967-C5)-methyltransferase
MGTRTPPGAHDGFAGLDERDRALVKQLVTGTERWKRLLDWYISAFSHRSLGKLAPEVLNALRLGAYQLVFMGLPAYAAVNSVVECLRAKSHRGFVNGVLRALARNQGHVEMPSIDDGPEEYAGIRYSFPDWIVSRYFESFGIQDALSLLKVQNSPPPVTLRVNTSKTNRGRLLEILRQAGFSAEPGKLGISIKVVGGRTVSGFPGYNEGWFAVQAEAAMIVTMVLDPEPGDLVWDVCAAPGGKTMHIAEMASDGGVVVATDVSRDRIALITQSSKRLGFDNVLTAVLDATDPGATAGAFERARLPMCFDKVLVDAPCSGLGVIAKHPDIKWMRREADIPEMARRQTLLLDTAARFLKPGGALVYSTCALTREENQDVWLRFLDGHREFVPVGERVTFDNGAALDMAIGYGYLLPHVHGTDGFFIAKALKRHG